MSRVSPFSRGVIFTRARVSLALSTILRKNGGLLVVKYYMYEGYPQGLVLGCARGIWPKLKMRSSALLRNVPKMQGFLWEKTQLFL